MPEVAFLPGWLYKIQPSPSGSAMAMPSSGGIRWRLFRNCSRAKP